MPPSAGRPGPHHPPPHDLADKDLSLRITDQHWFRFHTAGRDALFWGPRPYPQRFDAPSGEYGVLYAAADEHGALIETFGHATGIRRLGHADLASRYLSRIAVRRPLRLVDLTGARLAQLAADARLFAGEIAIAQLWSLAFHEHPSLPDGICYPSRHDPERLCAAIFDRAAPAISDVNCLGTLADYGLRPLLLAILATYQFGYTPGP